MSDKSYVTLECCPICGNETGNLLLDRRMRDTFEKYTINPTSVCSVCKEKYLKEGILLINPKTGSLAVIKESAFKRIFDKTPLPVHRIAFAEEELIQKFIKGDI